MRPRSEKVTEATPPMLAGKPAARRPAAPAAPGVAPAVAAQSNGPAALGRLIRDSLRSDLRGPYKDELRDAQRDVILQRTVVLIWISVFVMPTTIMSFVYFTAPGQLRHAAWIVGAAIAAALVLRLALARGAFRTNYHLAMALLVGGNFGPTAAVIMMLTEGSGGGSYLFAFFLIYFAFTALFPADWRWIVTTSAMIITSYVVSTLIASVRDPQLVNNLIYFMELTFIGVVLNRVICRLFFDERAARIELSRNRDALFAEMAVAQEIQTLLLPRNPVIPGYELHGAMTPAAEVGGDYYDVIVTESGRRLVAIGDVSGHGVTTGLTMMMVRASLVSTLESRGDASLPELYIAMNRCLRRNLERMDLRLYMTFALLEHLDGGRFRAVGAHLPLLVHRAARKSVEEIDMAGVWLGVLDRLTPDLVPETTFELNKGDTMLLLTDGVVEHDGPGGMFGFDRVHAELAARAEQGPEQVVTSLMAQLGAHGDTQDDDVTLLALRYAGDVDTAHVS
jgi:hypothetical protein